MSRADVASRSLHLDALYIPDRLRGITLYRHTSTMLLHRLAFVGQPNLPWFCAVRNVALPRNQEIVADASLFMPEAVVLSSSPRRRPEGRGPRPGPLTGNEQK